MQTITDTISVAIMDELIRDMDHQGYKLKDYTLVSGGMYRVTFVKAA